MAQRVGWSLTRATPFLCEPRAGPSRLPRCHDTALLAFPRPRTIKARPPTGRRSYASHPPTRPTPRIPTSSAEGESSSRPSRAFRYSLLGVLAWIPVLIFVDDHIFSFGLINGGSMTPSLNPAYSTHGISAPRDVVLLNRFTAELDEWEVGDVVVLVSPRDPNLHLTKRILGLPGDVVRFMDPEMQSRGAETKGKGKAVWSRVRIPPGHCWVEGDSSVFAKAKGGGVMSMADGSTHSSAFKKSDRSTSPSSESQQRRSFFSSSTYIDTSQDSRHFGPVPLALLTARVSHILYPPSRFGPISRTRPDGSTPAPASRPGVAGGSGWPWEWDWARMLGMREGEERRERRGKELEKWRLRRAREDSMLSPYLVDEKGEDDDRVRRDNDKDGELPPEDEARREVLRQRYNLLSRGGQLGETAEG